MENVLIISQNAPFQSRVDNVINFIAEFIADLIKTSEIESLYLISWKNIINYLIEVSLSLP
jgi:hypothetical protein